MRSLNMLICYASGILLSFTHEAPLSGAFFDDSPQAVYSGKICFPVGVAILQKL